MNVFIDIYIYILYKRGDNRQLEGHALQPSAVNCTGCVGCFRVPKGNWQTRP